MRKRTRTRLPRADRPPAPKLVLPVDAMLEIGFTAGSNIARKGILRTQTEAPERLIRNETRERSAMPSKRMLLAFAIIVMGACGMLVSCEHGFLNGIGGSTVIASIGWLLAILWGDPALDRVPQCSSPPRLYSPIEHLELSEAELALFKR